MMNKLALGALAALAFAAPALAQDFSAAPNYGTVRLTAGFAPDPYVVDVRAGGNLDASGISPRCRGGVSNAPDVRLHYVAGSLPLIISVASSADTTLVINGPDGSWYCNDDGGVNGLNPSLRWNSPQSGQYDIWVGSYDSSTTPAARLHISEVGSQ